MTKNIIFCADGTWNCPGQDENNDGLPDQTNVYKLFLALKGHFDHGSLMDEGEQEKVYFDEEKQIKQVAKYIHGVGDSKNPIRKLLFGATGSGTITRIIRGYTYISRMYQAGDNIYIVGFSRGAYTARALAAMIASQGLLKGISYHSKEARENAYMRASQVWFRHRSKQSTLTEYLAKLRSATAFLPGFISKNDIDDNDLIPVNIQAVAVWDTVGALGIPEFIGDGAKYDAFRFANQSLSTKIKHGFHAVALDERRTPFIPTLWDKADNVEQVLFPGAHADVGGGYPEHELSDIALCWMKDKLEQTGVLFDALNVSPNPAGIAHKPWKSPIFALQQESRKFNPDHIVEHSSITDRVSAGPVLADPKEQAKKYRPGNRPSQSTIDHNDETRALEALVE